MNVTEAQHSREEIAEIERHKYFLSEKAGHDVGWETALQDWEQHHAAQFRLKAKPEPKADNAQTTGSWLQRLLASIGLA